MTNPNKSDIEVLIERLQGLDGPCRECDAEIAAIGLLNMSLYDEADPLDNGAVNLYKNGKRVTKARSVLYTSSTDAAMTLIPDGLFFEFWSSPNGEIKAYLKKGVTTLNQCYGVSTFSLAHAICIAALRAIMRAS